MQIQNNTEENKKGSILIIDDSILSIKTLTNILESDYIIYSSDSGYNGVKIAREKKPDLIISDVIMPKVDGYDVLIALRKDDTVKDIPVIFITSSTNIKDEKKALSLGCVDYITKPFDEEIVKLRVAIQFSILNYIETIRHLSDKDHLTGLANRQSFDNRMELEWGKARRSKAELSVLIIDIDHFKDYNDTYGHLQGDVALQAISKTIASTLRRADDFAARWGGEEFIVLLPNTHSMGSLFVAEKIRNAVQQNEIITTTGEVTKMTISIGAYTLIPTVDTSPDTLIGRADTALYNAKKGGRNRVVKYM